MVVQVVVVLEQPGLIHGAVVINQWELVARSKILQPTDSFLITRRFTQQVGRDDQHQLTLLALRLLYNRFQPPGRDFEHLRAGIRQAIWVHAEHAGGDFQRVWAGSHPSVTESG